MTRALRERSSRESAQRVFFIRFFPSKFYGNFYLNQPGNRVLVWAATCALAQDDVSVGGRLQVPSSFSLDN